MDDEQILLDFLEKHKHKLEESKDNLNEIFDSMNEENLSDTLRDIVKFSKKKVRRAMSKISSLRPTLCMQFCELIHQLLHLPNEKIDELKQKDKNEYKSWREVIQKELWLFPVPIIRLLYERGEFTLDECTKDLVITDTAGFADLIPNYYFFAEDYPQVKLSRDWIITGCFPGSLCYHIKTDDVDSIKRIIDENYELESEVQVPYFEHLFFQYQYLIENIKKTPINVAAFYGAVRRFKYFLIIGSKITNDTAKMAVAGGNLEIFRICEQSGVNLDGCEKIAADFCRFSFMKWFAEVREKSAYSKNSVSSVLNVTSDQLNVDEFVSSKNRLLKLIEEGKDLKDHRFLGLLNNKPEEIQIPIARALLAHGLDPINLFTLGNSDKLFEFAMERADVKEALKKEQFLVTCVICELSDELFAKLEAKGILDYLSVYSLAIYDKKGERLYKVVAKDPSRIIKMGWEKIIENLRTHCFELIPRYLVMAINIKAHCKYNEVENIISAYKSLPDNIKLRIEYCSHPMLFLELKDKIESFKNVGFKFFNVFAIKQLGGKIKRSTIENAQKYDIWDLVKQII